MNAKQRGHSYLQAIERYFKVLNDPTSSRRLIRETRTDYELAMDQLKHQVDSYHPTDF